MTREEILNKIIDIAIEIKSRDNENLDRSRVTPETLFIPDPKDSKKSHLNFSSIQIIELVMAIEESFNLDPIRETVVESMRTVEDAVGYLVEMKV